jgi:tetratricopeptide (TPR) repeat protein
MIHQSIDDIVRQEWHRRFTNRETEIELFEQLVLLSDVSLRILGIHGSAGIGKSELLLEFKRLSKKWGVSYISIDGYAQKNILGILNRVKLQAERYISRHFFTEFDQHLFLYLQMQKTVLNDEDLVAEFRRAMDRRTIEKLDDSIVGSHQKDTALSLLHESFKPEDVEFYLNAEALLTEKLLEALRNLGLEKWVLFVDAYEMLSVIDDWIRDEFIRKLPASFRVVIAGREQFGHSWQALRPVFRSVQLISFGEEDTKKYLRKREVSEASLVQEIFNFTEGHPLYLAMSADAREDSPELSADDFLEEGKYIAIESIVNYARKSIRDPNVLKALDVCSIVRFFDEDTLRYFIDEDLPHGLFSKLLAYSFVKKRSYGYALHDAVWEFLNSEYRHRRPKFFRDMNQKAISDYNTRIEHAVSGDWQRFAIEILYHKVAIDPQSGLAFLIDIYNAAEIQYRLDFCEALIREAQTYDSLLFADWLTLFEARLANSRDDWEVARDIYSELLKDKSLGARIGAYALTGLGRAYYRLGEINRAEKLFIQALQAHNTTGQVEQTALLLHHLARIKIAQRKWQSAKKYLQDCLSQLDDILTNLSGNLYSNSVVDPKPVVEREKAATLSSFGTVFFEQGQWESALDQYTQSLEIFQRLDDKQGIARSLYRIGWTLQQKGNWSEALNCYQQSRDIFVELGADYWLARTIVKIADLNRAQGQLESSEKLYLECMRICIKLKAPLGIPVVLDCLGCLYQAKGLLRKAEKMHGKSLARKQEQAFPFEIELTFMNLGDLKVKQGVLEEALVYYSSSLELMKEMKYKHGEALLLVKMSEAIVTLGRVDDRVLSWLKRADYLSRKHKYFDIRCQVHWVRGNIHAVATEFSEALDEFGKALRYAENYNSYTYQDMKKAIVAQFNFWANVPDELESKFTSLLA